MLNRLILRASVEQDYIFKAKRVPIVKIRPGLVVVLYPGFFKYCFACSRVILALTPAWE